MVGHAKFALTLGCLLSVMLVGVSGCREAEQDRLLYHEKGVYLGPPDTVSPSPASSARVDVSR